MVQAPRFSAPARPAELPQFPPPRLLDPLDPQQAPPAAPRGPAAWPPPYGQAPLPPPPIPPAPRVRHDWFDTEGHPRARLLLGAVVAAIAYDAAARAGVATIGATLFVWALALVLVATGRLVSWTSRALVGTAALCSLSLVLRTSPCVNTPVLVLVAVLLLIGTSHAATSQWRSTFPQLGGRLVIAAVHLFLGVGLVRQRSSGPAGSPDEGGGRLRGAWRGIAIALPLVLVIGTLLAAADPVFEAWVAPGRAIRHLVLGAIGAWLFLGLCRVTMAKRPAPTLAAPPSLGTIEVVSVLGALTALYSIFVAAQLVAAFGGASRVLAHDGLTYAEYAHRGFFQLLAAAAITAATLLSLRACAGRSSRSVVVLGEVTIVLTLGIVAVAVRRLALYEDAYGYTLLRLGCSVTAFWIGSVFVLLAIAFARRTSRNQWLAPAIMLSALLLVVGWAVVNPAAIAVRSNAGQAAHGKAFDVHAAMSLGPDAVPALVGELGDLRAASQRQVRHDLCDRHPSTRGGLSYNRAASRAERAISRFCASPA